MKPLRILCVSSLYPPVTTGGAERVAANLNAALTAREHDVSVLTLHPSHDARQSQPENPQEAVFERRLRNLYWPFDTDTQPAWKRAGWHLINAYNPLMGREINALLRQLKPQVLMTHNIDGFSPAVWLAAKRHDVGIVHIAHDLGLACPSRTMYRDQGACNSVCRGCRIMTASQRSAIAKVDAVVSVSQALQDRFSDIGLLDHVKHHEVIHNPLPLKTQIANAAAITTKPKKRDKLHIGYVGRIEYVKGIELLLEALNRMGAEKPELTIAGRAAPAYQQQLIERYPWAASCFIGFAPMHEICDRINLLVVPSLLFEALGMGPLEAARFGVPALVATSGGLPETISPGTTGWLFESGDPNALVNAIRGLRDDPRSLEAASRACQATDFASIEKEKISRYEALLNHCAKAAQ